MQQFTVTVQDAGQRFDKYLKKLLPEASAGFLYKMLRKKNITLNGKKAEGKEKIEEKDEVTLFFSEETFRKFSGRNYHGAIGQNDSENYHAASDQNNSENSHGIPRQKDSGDFAESPACSSAQTSSKESAGRSVRQSAAKSAASVYHAAYRKLGDIPVVYEDRDILILNKPAGALSQKAEKNDISVNEWMIGYLLKKGELSEDNLRSFRPSVCNRLDRNTSGLILCGKTMRGSQFLSEVLRDRSLRKYYLVYVRGEMPERRHLKSYWKKDHEKNRVEAISESAYRRRVSDSPEIAEQYRKVEIEVQPLAYLEKEGCTKLEVRLITGKSHQIRAQLSAIGHPVVGDVKYGWKPDQQPRFLLHAYRLEFPQIEGQFAYLSGKVVIAPEPTLSLDERGADVPLASCLQK